jgi:gamma-glutamyltranspeptidase/glutathione hydrolase
MADRLPRPLLRGLRGAVACGHPLAAAAGGRALAAGGTAVDAAVAAGMALCVLLPDACGLGGDALALLHTRDGEERALNGSGMSPAAMSGPVPARGGGTVTVPGAVAALADLHGQGGRLDWAQVLEPAIALAGEGMAMTEDLHAAIARNRARLNGRCGHWPVLDPIRKPGMAVRQRALAGVISDIAADGPRAFYDGELAEAIARAARDDGGWLTADDLRRHHTVIAPPVVRERLGARVAVQPPVSQAVLLLTALGGVDRLGPLSGAERVHALVEALEEAFLHRDAIADPDAGAAVADCALRIDERHVTRPHGPGVGAHTTAVATADGEGTVVSMLLSVFEEFGSTTFVPSGGFVLNDRADGFTHGPNRARGGARPVHTLSPALAEQGDRVFALCTPGADGQVQTLAQVLVAIALDGMAIPAALDRPRFRTAAGRLAVEGDMDAALVEDLRLRGHDVVALAPGDMRFGAAACAGVDRRTGTVFAASDPRREAWATVV